MRWFRWYEGSCEDAKFRVVSRNAGVTVATVMGVWAYLLEDASHVDHRGLCTRGEHFYCTVLGLEEAEMRSILQHMHDIGIVNITPDHIEITNWNKRQFDTDAKDSTNAERQRRFRGRKRNGPVTDSNVTRNGARNGTQTPEADTDTDTEKKESPRSPPLKAKPNGRTDLATWNPGEQDYQYAGEQGVDAERILIDIRAWAANVTPASKAHKRNPSQFWQTWCRREADKLGGTAGANGPGRAGANRPSSGSVIAATNRILSRLPDEGG